MTPVFAARRRAEEFNLLVEDPSTGGLRDARHVEFLELVGALRETPRVEARPEFVAGLRERLMAEADVALAKVPTTTVNDRLTVAPRRTARERRFAVAVGGFAIVSATTTMAVAAQSALPGDVLYPLKRAIENAHTGFSVDDSSKGSTLLANASGRLDEVDALTRQGGADHGDATAIADTLGSFSAQASEASDLLIADYQNTGHTGSISRLRDFTSSAMVSLSGLESVVPDAARGALITAAQILVQIDTSAQSLCPDCGGARIDIVPPFVTQLVPDPFSTVASIFTVDAAHPGAKPGRPAGHRGDHKGGQAPVQQPGAVNTDAPEEGVGPGQPTGGKGANAHPGNPNGPLGPLTDILGGGHTPTSNHSGGQPDLGPVDDVLGGVGDVLGDVLGGATPAP
ncbi:MAG: hypothetical protein JWO11_2799 [Nocardioides sp.]|nr:hypothetical protein [Nocardioides sp.]